MNITSPVAFSSFLNASFLAKIIEIQSEMTQNGMNGSNFHGCLWTNKQANSQFMPFKGHYELNFDYFW